MTLFSNFFDGHQQNRKSPKVPFLLINNDFRGLPGRFAKTLFIGSIPIATSNIIFIFSNP